MKKISMLFLSLLAITLMVGCGTKTKKLVCTTKETEDGMDFEQVISMTYKNDKLKSMKVVVNTKITDSDVQKNWQEFKEYMEKENKEFNKDGVSLKVEENDKKYEYKTILDIDVENATEEALKEQGFDGLKDSGNTLESNKEEAEKDGATCEIK